MLRIEKKSDGRVTRLLLSGRIQFDRIACIRSALRDACERTILNLSEVTLVDVAGIRFLIRCEQEGVELAECPLYVRRWMLCERTEGPDL